MTSQIDQLKINYSQEIDKLNGVVDEKVAEINGLESEVEKCKESISCKSLEIDHLNEAVEQRNTTITSLEASINQLHQDIACLNTNHSEEINEKVRNKIFNLSSLFLYFF